MESFPPSILSETTGTTGTTKKNKSRMNEIIKVANAVKSTLESGNMPAVTNDLHRELIFRAVESILRKNVRQEILQTLTRTLHPVVDDDDSKAFVDLANSSIQELFELYERQVQFETSMPPPSSYAKHAVWATWQKKADAILCFRPNDKKGIPLCVLDDIFREFQHQATATLPSTRDAGHAMRAAFNLCHTMPDNFDAEDDRSKAFDKCLEPIFKLKFWRKQVPIEPDGEVHGGQVDRTYEVDGVILIIREDKVETGTGNDVYMQVVRDYQLFVKESRNQNSTLFQQGAPVFLLCLLGPILLICGGFHDMKSTIVEPLAEPCLLFDDLLHSRQEVLARQLFALKKAVDTLSNRFQVDKINGYPAGVPRVYTKYKTEDGSEQSLAFSRPLESCPPRSLLFVAKDNPQDPAGEKLVKLALTYGIEVHRLLANSHFAPVLYGHSSLRGAPTAYVMEFLRPHTNGKSGWVTLWEFFKSKERATRYSKAIETTLGRILKVMEDARMVHGDLRPNNIMLLVDSDGTPANTGEEEGVNLKVVDFDWAGESGSVCYPLQQNQEIEWPGDPGEHITTRHDRALVEGWWYEQCSSEFQAPDSDMLE